MNRWLEEEKNLSCGNQAILLTFRGPNDLKTKLSMACWTQDTGGGEELEDRSFQARIYLGGTPGS
jgi:hypothetical protein